MRTPITGVSYARQNATTADLSYSLISFQNIGQAATGTVVAAVVGKKIRVVSLFLAAAGAVNVYLADGDSLELFGTAANPITLAAAGDQVCLPFSPHGHFETGAGETLDLILSGAVSIAGGLTFVTV